MFRQLFVRLLSVFALVFAFAGPALAEVKIGTVDFQRALNEVGEGAAAKARLESMFAEKKAAIDKMQTNLQAMQTELEKQSVILSDAAKKQKEDEFYQAQAQFQQAYQRSEGEMQQAYSGAMETLIEKMKKLSQTIATEKGYTLVVEVNEGGIIYTSPTIDFTDELIKRYNAANPVAAPKTTPTPTAPKK
jgi:outer membrane protein